MRVRPRALPLDQQRNRADQRALCVWPIEKRTRLPRKTHGLIFNQVRVGRRDRMGYPSGAALF